MISAPRAQILTDADCAGGTSYKTQEKMKLIFFFFFFPVEYISTSICKLICNIIICCFCHRSAACVTGQRPATATGSLQQPSKHSAAKRKPTAKRLCVCTHYIHKNTHLYVHIYTYMSAYIHTRTYIHTHILYIHI